MKSFLVILIFTIAATALPARVLGGEHIVVSGGVSLYQWEKYKAEPHDLWWLNFIRAARLKIQELRERHGPDAPITWFVYETGYRRRAAQEGKDLMSDITSVRDAFKVKLVLFSRTSELVNYLNAIPSRSSAKIDSFDFFGHSNRACFMFDYSNEIDSASKVFLHEDDLGQIRRGLFARNAEVKSWGCHTGESMSKKWKAATGVPMTGAIGKTRYQTETLPIISTVGGRWVR
jgi:hypothetical protein